MKNAVYIILGIVVGMVALEVIRGTGLLSAEASQNGGFPGESGMMFGTGGASDNKMDSCWVLDRRKGKNGKEKTTLALYSMVRVKGVLAIKYNSARQIDWDLRVPAFNTTAPSVQKIKKDVEKAEKAAQKAEETGKKPKKGP